MKGSIFSDFTGIRENISPYCPTVKDATEAEMAGVDWYSMTLYRYEEEENEYTYPRCIDCRTYGGGSHDRKPSFWPNDHF